MHMQADPRGADHLEFSIYQLVGYGKGFDVRPLPRAPRTLYSRYLEIRLPISSNGIKAKSRAFQGLSSRGIAECEEFATQICRRRGQELRSLREPVSPPNLEEESSREDFLFPTPVASKIARRRRRNEKRRRRLHMQR